MPKTIAILAHVDRMWPRYGASGTDVYFSLNLTAAVEGVAEPNDPAAYLSPWDWRIDGFEVLRVSALTVNEKALDAAKVDLPATAVSPGGGAEWTKMLVEHRSVLEGDGDPAKWSPGSFQWTPPKPDEHVEPREQDADRPAWHGVLLHVSTYPTPLPQVANLSFLVTVPEGELAGVEEVVFAPVFAFGAGALTEQRKPMIPTAAQRAIQEGNPIAPAGAPPDPDPKKGPRYYRWEYEPSNPTAPATEGPAIRAYQEACRWNVPPPEGSIELTSGWIAPAAMVEYREDWAAELHTRAADAFDLSQHLLAAAARIGETAAAPVAEAIVATMRDLAGIGMHRRLDARDTLMDEILDGLGTDADRDVVRTALLAFDASVGTVGQWVAWLTTNLKELGGGSQATPPAFPPAGPVELQVLHRLHACLSDPDNVARIVCLQWRSALGVNAAVQKFWDDHHDEILARFRRVAVRSRLALEQVTVVWPRLIELGTGASEAAQLGANLRKALLAYAKGRLGLPGAEPGYADRHPRFESAGGITDLITALEAHVTEFLDGHDGEKGYVKTRYLPGADSLAELPPTTVPDGIAIKVDALASRDGADDAKDVHRKIAGVGILFRRSSATPSGWSCLNLARLVAEATPGEPDPKVTIADVAVAPSSIGESLGVRRAFLVYDNHPLVAESPAAGLTKRPSNTMSGLAVLEGRRRVRYRNPYGRAVGGTIPTMTPLTFGEDYEAAAFAYTNGGCLPKEIARGTDPRMLGTTTPPGTAVFPVGRYTRRVPIGQVRIGAASPTARLGAKQEMDQLGLPPIPSATRPLARARAAKPGGDRRSEPLVLLAPWSTGRSSFAFRVRPPAVDINTWDRWVNRTLPLADRTEVWAGFHELADRADKSKELDITIDDPAVERFVFRLTAVVRQSGGVVEQVVKTLPVALPPAAAGRLGKVQRRGLLVITTLVGTKDAADVVETTEPNDATKPAVEVRVPEGAVLRLETFAAVPQANVQKRFHAAVAKLAQAHDTDAIFAPLPLLLEGATARLPSAKTVHDALIALPTREGANAGWSLRLVLPSAGDPADLDAIGRVEVLMQRWRWQGRPLPSTKVEAQFDAACFFEAATPKDPNDPGRGLRNEALLAAWDGALFGDRDASDLLRQETAVDFEALADWAPDKDGKEVRLLDGTIGTEPAATYFRFAVRAYSRYEGLWNASVDSRTLEKGDDPATVPSRWRRLVLKSRFHDEIPPPAVKLVVPLTESMRAPVGGKAFEATPGLLVVLNEPWFQCGGLAESLEVGVMEAQWPVGVRDSLLELGPDPILTSTGLVPPTAPPLAGRVIGPLGYTFDTDTDAPRFVHSSFLVQPPAALTVERRDAADHVVGTETIEQLGWFFVKLRFRRRLEPSGVEQPGVTESAWTQGTWTQFLPPFSQFRVTSAAGVQQQHVADMRVVRANDTWGFVGADGKPLVLEATPTDPDSRSRFRLYALMTAHLVDASGQLVHERLVALRPLRRRSAADPASVIDDREEKDVGRLRFRLLEIQTRRADGDAPDAGVVKSLGELFLGEPVPPKPDETPGDDGGIPRDARARIVRMSEPIDWKSIR